MPTLSSSCWQQFVIRSLLGLKSSYDGRPTDIAVYSVKFYLLTRYCQHLVNMLTTFCFPISLLRSITFSSKAPTNKFFSRGNGDENRYPARRWIGYGSSIQRKKNELEQRLYNTKLMGRSKHFQF